MITCKWCYQFFNDSSKFIKLPNLNSFLTTLRLEDLVNKFLNKLCKAGIISDEQYKKLYVSDSSPGILYGLPKIHKPNLPMRPILVAYNSTVDKLSKFLVPLIEQFTVNEFSLKNSYEFYNSIVHHQCQDNAFLISFDIFLLYILMFLLMKP